MRSIPRFPSLALGKLEKFPFMLAYGGERNEA